MIADLASERIDFYDSINKSLVQTKVNTFHKEGKTKCLKYLSNKFVASCSNDSTISIWDPTTWKLIFNYTNHTDEVNSLDQIDAGKMVSGSNDGTIQIWKISSGETLKKINVNIWINSVRVLLSSSLQLIACGCLDVRNNLRIYNYTSGDLVKILNGHTAYVNAIEVLSNTSMASGGNDNKVIIWDLSTYSIKYTLVRHKYAIHCIKQLSSSLVASGDKEGSIIIWNWLKGDIVNILSGHASTLSFNSLDLFDERTLISGSWDKTIKFWNISSGQLIQSINVNISISSLVMLKKSEFILKKI